MVWFSLWVFLTLVTPIWGAGRVEGLYLSFGQDPCTSMQVSWLGGEGRVRAEYRAMGDRAWREQDGERLERELPLCRVQLKALRPDTEYLLRIEGMQGGIRRFRTMPRALTREVRFVVAGDGLRQRRRFQQVKERICLAKPDFVVIGGDIAYAVRGRRSTRGSAAKWRAFVRHWSDARTSEGRLIPLLFVVGNHDAAHHEAQTFALLAGEDRTYRAVDLGGYLSLFLLDTGHVAPLEGAQTRWLGEVLQQRAQVPCKIAVYHVAAFPSVYSYEGRVLAAVWGLQEI